MEFSFWYDETYTYKGWFVAKDKEEAIRLLEKVENGEMGIDELEGSSFKDKNYTIGIGFDTLESLDDN
jgi:hypothetical protein